VLSVGLLLRTGIEISDVLQDAQVQYYDVFNTTVVKVPAVIRLERTDPLYVANEIGS
jgi:hypothetical protein